jgi:hypothetical protein
MSIKKIIIGLTLPMLLSSGVANAGYTSSGFQDKGYIFSGEGKKCGFTQEEVKSSYFSDGGISGSVGVLTFDDSNCMSADSSGLSHMLNKDMINKRISAWYSHSDADFKTSVNKLYGGSAFQEKGECMQSATYPIIGVTIDYILNKKGAIAAVNHGSSVGGCVATQ